MGPPGGFRVKVRVRVRVRVRGEWGTSGCRVKVRVRTRVRVRPYRLFLFVCLFFGASQFKEKKT